MRNLGLDILRFIAIILVLGRHLIHLPPTVEPVLKIWQTGGWIGVDLFFVLSGFLVSGLLFREYINKGHLEIKRFLVRRGLKIYPAFYVLITFTLIVLISYDCDIRKKSVLAEVLFVQNYLGGLWGPHWSLAVEEHFYIGIAVLFFVMATNNTGKRDPFSLIPLVFIVIAISCLSLRIVTAVMIGEYSYRWLSFATHVRIDSLMYGVLLSYLWYFKNLASRMSRIPTFVLVAFGVLNLVPAFIYGQEHLLMSVVGVIPVYFGSGLLLLAAIRLEGSGNRFLLICGALGGASYSIYLWHMPINTWGWDLFALLSGRDHPFIYLAFYLLLSLGCGFFMSKVIEWPVLRLRDRFFPPAEK